MFEVLVYVYENYWRGEECPELNQLGRKLSAAGKSLDEAAQGGLATFLRRGDIEGKAALPAPKNQP